MKNPVYFGLKNGMAICTAAERRKTTPPNMKDIGYCPETSYTKPARGGPSIDDTPLIDVRKPNTEASESRPKYSTMTSGWTGGNPPRGERARETLHVREIHREARRWQTHGHVNLTLIKSFESSNFIGNIVATTMGSSVLPSRNPNNPEKSTRDHNVV